MEYKKIQPDKALAGWLECYYEWTGMADSETVVQSPPTARTAIVFNLGAPTSASHGEGEKIAVPMAFVCGQFTSNYRLTLNGRIHMIGIVFRAWSIHDFFGVRMSMLVNNRMDLSLLLGDLAAAMHEQLTKSKTTEERVSILEKFLLERLPAAQKKLNVIDDAVAFIDDKRGVITVQEVAEKFNISKRYLEKRFLEKVGTSPKMYARTIRFSYISTIIANQDKVDWQEIVEQHGLHDQSHLVKEFMEFNKRNPSEYHQTHVEMVRFVKK